MFSKILIKLVDEAVLPAILLISTRILSVILLGRYFDIDVSLNSSGFSFTQMHDYVLINSYSTLAMIVVLSVGLLYTLVKSVLFHETHITPSLTAKLFSLRLSTFIQTSFDVYSQGVIWLSYSYLLTAVAGILAFLGFLYMWIFVISLLLVVLTTYIFILDVENEVFSKKKPTESVDEFVLTLGGIDDL